MARFQLDQNVSATLALLLRGLGHDVVTTNDAGLLDAHDDVQLLAAAKADRVLITHNREDFRLLHRAWRRWTRDWQIQRSHAGILVIPQYPLWSPERSSTEVDSIARLPLTDELYVYDWQTGQGWQRQPAP